MVRSSRFQACGHPLVDPVSNSNHGFSRPPRLRSGAAPTPRFLPARRMSLTGSPEASISSAVSSVDPSSTMMISLGCMVWLRTEWIAPSAPIPRLKTGITTEISAWADINPVVSKVATPHILSQRAGGSLKSRRQVLLRQTRESRCESGPRSPATGREMHEWPLSGFRPMSTTTRIAKRRGAGHGARAD